MARISALERMGFFPLPEAEARRIRRHVLYPASKLTALDPCAGEGKALALITEGASGQRCGIELDAYRAEQAATRLDQVMYADCFDADCRVESLSLLYVNPPYQDAVHEDGPGQRLKELFLRHVYRWLKPGGVLILVIPIAQLPVCGNILSRQFKETQVYRLTEPASVQYHQIVVFAVRRSRRERERLQDREITAQRLDYGHKARSFETLPVLSEQPQRVYAVPEAEPIQLAHHGLTLDEIEDCLPQSPAYRQAWRILFAPESRERGRPLTPLHAGHVSILACASALDGIFGEGELRHASRWHGVKTILRLEEQDDEGVTTIREKEQFSHFLILLYSDGTAAVLTAEAAADQEEPAGESIETLPSTAVPVEEPARGSRRRRRKFRIEESTSEKCS
jgi:SAM-dependent methyltransferase